MKQMKVLGVLAVALTLGLTACGGTKECKTHKWGEWEIVTAETCTTDGLQRRTCTVCKKVEEKKINKGHKWGSWETVTASTCTVQGSEKRTCSRCNEVETRDLDLAPHTYAKDEEGNDVVVWTQVADCENGGVGTKTCTVCDHVENVTQNALGHLYAKDESGEDIVNWTKRANCTEAGIGTKTCTREGCGHVENVVEAALGHDVHLVDDQGDPEEGKAKVRLYECSRCDVTYLGFKATEVTPASKERLVFETITTDGKEEQGARFFGHPIGNDCELDPTTGDPAEGVAAVYSKDQTGDYFEYKFDLTADQVAALSGDEDACLCYCDALPANWMQQNNMDFFAKGSETDWTKAYYIDDDPAHYNEDGSAKEIAGWRYVLYVDGHYQDFDANVASNPMKNNNRGEFVMPYLFKLHTGENSISLRMAAGYRCTFFNFTFRPYVKPTQVTASPASIELTEGETQQITSTMEGLEYKSASSSIATVNSSGLVTAVKAGETKITVSKSGNYKSLEIPVKVNAPAGVVDIPAVDAVINPAEGGIENYHSGSSGDWLRNPKKDTTLTYTINSVLAGKFDVILGLRGSNIGIPENMSMTVNGANVALAGTVNTQYSAVEYTVGQADLIKGENTLVITFLADSSLYLKNVKVQPHQLQLIKTWSSEDIKAGLTEGKTLTEKDFGNSLPGVKGYKFNKDDVTCTLTYTAEAAMEVELQLLLGVKKGNQAKTGFWRQADSTADPKPEKDSITVNGKKVTPPEQDVDFTDCVTESDQSDNGTLMVPAWKTVCNISLQQGENTIVIAYVAGGYSLYLCGARIGK